MARNRRPSTFDLLMDEAPRLRALSAEDLDRKIVFLDSRAAIFATDFDKALAAEARRIRDQRG